MLTEKLAEFVVDTDVRNIPPKVLEGSRDALIDTIGCALAGSLEPVSEIAGRWGSCAPRAQPRAPVAPSYLPPRGRGYPPGAGMTIQKGTVDGTHGKERRGEASRGARYAAATAALP